MSRTPLALLWPAVVMSLVVSVAPVSAQKAPLLPTKIPTTPANVVYHPDKTYRTLGKVTRELDIACPKQARGPLPTVVLLHGVGTLTRGRKGQVPLMFELAQQGFVGVAVSFNHNPEGDFLSPIHDVKAAIRWLRSEAKTYNIDPEQIGVIGFSAGSCLGCLLGMTTPDDRLEGDVAPNAPSSKVQAVVGYFGPSDFKSLHNTWTTPLMGLDPERVRRPILLQNLEGWFGGSPARIEKRYELLSPLSYARKEAAPLLLLHGKQDRVIPPEQSEKLERKLSEKGAKVTLKLFEKAGHDFDENNDDNARQAAVAARTFLLEHLRKR